MLLCSELLPKILDSTRMKIIQCKSNQSLGIAKSNSYFYLYLQFSNSFLYFKFIFVFAFFAHMMIMFVPGRPPCPACLRVHCLQTKMQIHDRVSGFSRKIEQIIAPAPLVTNPVEKFIFPAKRFHLARRHLPLQRLQARQDEVGFVKQNFQKVT